MNERESLLQQIQQASFGINELNLYLDTHPDEKTALSHYQHYRKMRNDAITQYAMKYGPLTPYDSLDTADWTWANEPWPWQNE